MDTDSLHAHAMGVSLDEPISVVSRPQPRKPRGAWK